MLLDNLVANWESKSCTHFDIPACKSGIENSRNIFLWNSLSSIRNGDLNCILNLLRTNRYGSIQGTSRMFVSPIALLAPVYAGWVYDFSGSYTIAFTTFAVMGGFAAFFMFLIRTPKPPAQVTDIREIVWEVLIAVLIVWIVPVNIIFKQISICLILSVRSRWDIYNIINRSKGLD